MLKYLLIVILWVSPVLTACSDAPSAGDAAQVIYLVRHAEKEAGPDPDLTREGDARAAALAQRLENANLQVIYSTDLARTRQTAAPISRQTGLQIIYYDPARLDALAERIKADGRNTLVVGHSNTTPDLAQAFGGEGGSPIVEATEYDRLYVLTVDGDAIATDLQRFGAPSAR